MEPFEVQGEWWLPERPDRHVPGTLTFSPQDGAALSLIGSFRRHDEIGTTTTDGDTTVTTVGEDDLEEAGTYPRIHGLAENTSYNLEDCFSTNLSGGLFGGQATERVHVNIVLKGAIFSVGEELEATGISVDLRYFVTWIARTGLTYTIAFDEQGRTRTDVPVYALEANRLPTEVQGLDDGAQLTLTQRLGRTGDRISDLAVHQNFTLRLDYPKKTPLRDLLDRVGDLQALVSIGANRTASFESIQLWHPDIVREVRDDTMELPTEVFAQWVDDESRDAPRDVSLHDMVFTMNELGGIAGVRDWMRAATKHRSELGRVVGSRGRRSAFLGDRLLSYAAALEAFDRTRHGRRKRYFAKCIKRCVALAGQPFDELVGDTGKWVTRLKDERNDVAHHLGTQAITTTEQYLMTESAYWLFAYCMLRAANAPAAVFDRIRGHHTMQHLGRQVRASL